MAIENDRDPEWVTKQIEADNDGTALWSARFEILAQGRLQSTMDELKQARASSVANDTGNQIVVEFNALLVRQIAEIGVKYGRMMLRMPRLPRSAV